MIIQQFDSALFLREYWQKKPCVIKQFVKEFIDPIDEHDLAGLAQETGVDCRIVSKTIRGPNRQYDWQVAQGPFTSFEELCEGDWSLLVQGVDRYIPEIDLMAKRVDFIPNWRFDDVMVSFSVANAGVGAHTDQYDVFIIQGKGSRRWQVGLPIKGNVENLSPHPLLRQIAGFESIIDEVLTPGDVIYIPPNHPHNGVALEDCLNYSIGFRSPTHLEALTGLLDESDTLDALQQRYTDPNIDDLRASNLDVTEVSRSELQRVKQGIVELLDSPQAEKALLQYLSRQGLPDLSNEDVYSVAEVEALFEEGTQIYKTPGVRAIYIQSEGDLFSFCIDGNTFEVPASMSTQVKQLLNDDEFLLCKTQFNNTNDNALGQNAGVNLVTQLLNAAYWEV